MSNSNSLYCWSEIDFTLGFVPWFTLSSFRCFYQRVGTSREVNHQLEERNLGKIIGVIWKDKVIIAEILNWTGQQRLQVQDILGERRFRFAGYILREAPERPAHCAVDWTSADGRRQRGRSKKTWWVTYREDIQVRGVSWSEVETITTDRVHWWNLRLVTVVVPWRTGGLKY